MQHKRHLAELRTTRVEKEQLLQRVHDLETQLKASEGEVEDITMEVELLKSKLKEAQSTTGSVPATRLHVFLCMWYLGGFSLLVLKAEGEYTGPTCQLLVLQICFMVVLCCMVFSLGFCCCRISAESKAFQLQRQVDTIKSEKLRVESGVCWEEGGGGGYMGVVLLVFFFSRTRRTETSD